MTSARKGKVNLDEKLKSKKYNHSLVMDAAGKGKDLHYSILLFLW